MLRKGGVGHNPPPKDWVDGHRPVPSLPKSGVSERVSVEFHSIPVADWREFALAMWALVETVDARYSWVLSSEITAVSVEARRLLDKHAYQYAPAHAQSREITDQQSADAVAQQKLDELRAGGQTYMRIGGGPWLSEVKVALGVSRWEEVTEPAELARLEQQCTR